MNKKVGLIVGVLIALTVVIYVIFTLLGNDKGSWRLRNNT